MSATPAVRRNLRKPMALLLSLGLLGLLIWYAQQNFSLQELAARETQLRELIAASPWRSFFIGFVVYLGLAFVPGTGGKAVVWGWLFGFWLALITVSIGLTIAAMVIFSLSRYLFRDLIERRYGSFLSLMDKHLEKEGAFYLLTLRMAHAPFSIVNPVSGASRVRTWTFFWTTAVGLTPANVIWILVGINLPSLHELAANGAESFVTPPLVLALVGCALLPLLVRWLISHFGMPGSGPGTHDATRHDTHRSKS